MSAINAFVERTKKTTQRATEASHDQVHAYVGANDYFYDRARRRRATPLQDLPGNIAKAGITPLRDTLEAYAPNRIRETVQGQFDVVRARRQEMADRGETIIKDWKQAAAVKDADALISSVRAADGVAAIAQTVRSWAADYPAAPTAKTTPANQRTANQRTAATKSAT